MLKTLLINYKENHPNDKTIKDVAIHDLLNKVNLDLPIKQKICAILLDYTEPPKCYCGNELKWSSKRKEHHLHGTAYGGWLEFCSRECMQKSPSIIEKRRATNLIRYGTISWAQSTEAQEILTQKWSDEKKHQFREKTKQTNLLKRGVEHHSQTQEYLNKRTATTLKQTNGQYTNHFQDIEKIKKKCLEKYNVDHYNKTDQGKKKLSENNAMRDDNIKRKSRINRMMLSSKDKILSSLLIENNTKEIKEYFANIMTENGFCFRQQLAYHLNISYSHLNAIMRVHDMRDAYLNYGKGKSYKEANVYEFVKSLGVNVYNSDRTLLGGQEIDIICPDHKLGIEFNGMKWHSVLGGKDKDFHLNKTQIMESKGYQLLHIFESEWDNPIKQEIWKSIIKSKLGILANRIYARKCNLIELEPNVAKTFFNENHLSGHVPARHYCGLEYNGNLFSAISYGPSRFSRNETELHRFVCLKDHHIIGALGKFISHINDPKLVTFADRRIAGAHNAYDHFFSKKTQLSPSWWGMEVGVYLPTHRLSFTKEKMVKLLGPNYNYEKTVLDNMFNNGYDIIYDCGNWKYSN